VEQVGKCEITMIADRDPVVFIFRALVTTIIVVFGSLLTAIFMHAEEHSGDRASVLYIAFLISLTNMATTNLGLGKVSTLLWYDLFNLSQLLLSLVAVAETMVVHLLFKHNAGKLATHIDSVCRQTLPALYIGVTAGIFIYGIGRGRELYTSVGFAIMGIFIITMIPATLFFVWVRQGRLGRWQAKCIKELKKANPADGKEYDTRVEVLKASHDEIKFAIKDQMKALGVSSVKTEFGTVSMANKTRYSTQDWDSFKAFIVEHDVVDLLEKRIAQTNMAKFLEDNPGVVPPGLNAFSDFEIRITKPR
jgi:hypothetical protein